ncbi:hypothetical protein Tco_0546300 [Tanacetum coccineum]
MRITAAMAAKLCKLSTSSMNDDAMFVGEWSESNISMLVNVLDCFHRVSGLKINMSKSKIMRVHVDDGKVSRAANKLGCLVLKPSFLYLGIDLWEGICIEMFKVPSGILRILESIRCHFFNGHDMSSKKVSWVQWNKVLAPKDKGGLTSIIRYYAFKLFMGGDGNIGVVSNNGTKSVWMNIVSEINVLSKKGINLMEFLRIKLGNGESTLFWEDSWCEGGRLKDTEVSIEHMQMNSACCFEARSTVILSLCLGSARIWSLNISGCFPGGIG